MDSAQRVQRTAPLPTPWFLPKETPEQQNGTVTHVGAGLGPWGVAATGSEHTPLPRPRWLLWNFGEHLRGPHSVTPLPVLTFLSSCFLGSQALPCAGPLP